MNGNPISIIVSDVNREEIQQGEDEDSLTKASLDAASVADTLHVLEGIAAEGKGWFQGQATASGCGNALHMPNQDRHNRLDR
jgi:hypothetical protein